MRSFPGGTLGPLYSLIQLSPTSKSQDPNKPVAMAGSGLQPVTPHIV